MSTTFENVTALPMVEVHWLDSAEMPGWQLEDDAQEQRPLMVRTVGLLLHENDDCVTVAASVTEQGGPNAPLSIPRCAIIGPVWELKVR